MVRVCEVDNKIREIEARRRGDGARSGKIWWRYHPCVWFKTLAAAEFEEDKLQIRLRDSGSNVEDPGVLRTVVLDEINHMGIVSKSSFVLVGIIAWMILVTLIEASGFYSFSHEVQQVCQVALPGQLLIIAFLICRMRFMLHHYELIFEMKDGGKIRIRAQGKAELQKVRDAVAVRLGVV